MKAWLKEFGRSVLQKVIILGSIALGVAVIVFFATRPAISESILDTITLEDGHYSLDGLRAGMTRDEVAAHLDDRKLVYFDGQPTVYLLRGSVETASGTTWISLSDETRVKELGRVTVRRTYYFQDGLLTHVDLETDVVKGKIMDDIARVGTLVETLESAFGPASGPDLDGFAEKPGERVLAWYGTEDSELSVSARYYQLEDWVKSRGQAESNKTTHTDHFELTIRVIL